MKETIMNTLDINQIKEYLPHRYPLLLVDRVLDYEVGKSITAIKNVTINEILQRAFSAQACHARRADDRGAGADGCVAVLSHHGQEA